MKPSCFVRISDRESAIKAALVARPFAKALEVVLPMPAQGDHPIDLIKLQHAAHSNRFLSVTIEGLRSAKWKG
jgi:hypothetical protein